MSKKLKNIINKYLTVIILLVFILAWQLIVDYYKIPTYLLPSPKQIITALINDRELLFKHTLTTIFQAIIGLILSIIFAYFIAILMDLFKGFNKVFSSILVISQTIPTIAIAPLLVIWLGYGDSAKIAVVFLVCFFPITMSLVKGFKGVDNEMILLMKTMNASKKEIFYHVKLLSSLDDFFSGLKLATTYAIIGAVIAQWLGGESGLGVYMIRVRKSFEYDKMFAAIILISIISLLLVWFVAYIEKKTMPWKFERKE